LSVNESGNWFELAACRAVYARTGMDYWHSPEPGDPDFTGTGQMPAARLRMAKKTCNGCPVRMECLTYALERGEKDGIWAGLAPHERRDLMRRWAGLASAEQAQEMLATSREPVKLAEFHKRGRIA
jgi:hypothetical protein